MKKKFNRYLSTASSCSPSRRRRAAAFDAAAVYAVRTAPRAARRRRRGRVAALCYAAFKWVFLPYQETKKILQLLWAAIRCRASTTCATRSAPRWRTRCSACAPSSIPTS
ncbi:MAG: hypothetical protein ACLVL7_06330 [Anaerotruncus massiliensis (ex Togo et al. 2019)]